MATHNCVLLNGALVDTRFAAGNVLLDWVRLGFGANDLASWYFDEGTGTNIDDKVAANDLTVSGAYSWQDGWIGAASLRLTGTNGLVSDAMTVADAASWTLEWWERCHRASNNTFLEAKMIELGYTSPWLNKYYWTHRMETPFDRSYWSDGSTYTYNSNSGALVLDDTWYLYTVTYDATDGAYGRFTVYRNGVAIVTWQPASLAPRANTTSFQLYGPRDATDQYDWSGVVYATGVQRSGDFSASAIRYPTSGTWTEASGEAEANCLPGVLTATLAAALPAGTSLKAKLLSAAGGDTGWQTLSGSGTTYTYDFTGQVAGDWRAALQPYAGGALNINTPEISGAQFEYSTAMGLYLPEFLGYMQPEYGVA